MINREEIAPLARSFGLALSVHVLMVLLVWLGTYDWKPFRQPEPVGVLIEAVIVDTSEIRKQREEALEAAKQAEKRKLEQDRRTREMEQQREREKEAEVKRQKEAEVKQQKEAEVKQQKEAEVKRQEALDEQRRKKLAEEAQRKKEAQDKLQQLRQEQERKLEEERVKQQKELEKVREQREAADRQQKLEAERLKQLEVRKAADEAELKRRQQEAEQQKQLQAAERQKQLDAEQRAAQAGQQATKSDEYVGAIRALVTQNWLRPPTAQVGLRCKLRIVQIPGGEVISATIMNPCNGDETTRRSIVAAVERVGALPYRGFEDVFKREIDFNFIYDGD